MKQSTSLWQTARAFRGNQRAAIIAEPFWAIPYNLFLPFASVYMMAVGLRDSQIGALASLGLAMQFVCAVFSGAIVDKFGRRSSLLIFGFLSWAVPCVLWAVAREYWWFVIAVLFNSMWRIVSNSFNCMMIEDAEDHTLIRLYTVLSLIGLVGAFLPPVVGLCFDRYSLKVTMSALYALSAVVMTVKYIVHYRLSNESVIGLTRMRESKERSLFSLTFGGWGTFVSLLHNPRLLLLMGLMALTNCFNTVQATFWPLFVTTAYNINPSMLSWFPPMKAFVTAVVLLFLTTRINLRSVRRPLLAGLVAQALGLAVLLTCRLFGGVALAAVIFSAVCEAFALAIMNPLCDSLLSVTIPPQERARVFSLIIAVVIIVSMPIGWISGQLSQHNRILPLVLNLCLIAGEMMIALRIARMQKQDEIALQSVSSAV